ncbi:SDR family oxidoreductase [Sphingomicrobium sp. XHP0239]|uniref:SDR family NAD(P)-dependent oxidoreductase n=1 Tax=Sphingomicrobium maritimum TaxID=3133972 RepID=UPI0031CCD93E
MTRILITGAASGIGKACAEHFDTAGADLVLVDRNRDALAKVAGEHEHHIADVADAGFWSRLDPGPLDGAIVNAGIGSAAPITDLTFEDWRKVMAVNLDGAFLTLQAALRHATEEASIVTIASASGLKAIPQTAAYGTSKAALIHLTKVAAAEAASRRIRVNAIAPGGVDTPIWDPMVDPAQGREKFMRAMEATVPIGRYAQPDEIARQAAFLMSEAAATITGSVLVCDGGFTL